MIKFYFFFVLAFTVFYPFSDALSKEKEKKKSGPKEVNVESIKEKYWARGDSSELGVVQNRLYSKSGKFQLGGFGGLVSSDPFLSVKTVGGHVGFHFSEYLGASFVAWKHYVSPSAALLTFEENRGATANTNEPKSYYGVEGTGSLLYGKLSLLGAAIIYYDLHLSSGLGLTNTESGKYLTPSLGVGQRFYVSRVTSIRVDYRLMLYRETILEKEIPTKIGQEVGKRNNWSNSITLGVDFLLEIF